ncbi:stage II sporulation protein E [Syntrophomonas erecta]
MLERVEIYPYQRITDSSLPGRSARKHRVLPFVKGWYRKGQAFLVQGAKNLAGEIMTIDNLILGIGALLLARAFVLGELLPFVYAYVAAFGYRYRERALLLALFSILGLATTVHGLNFWVNTLTLFMLVGVVSYIKIPRERLWWGLPFTAVASILLGKSIFLLLSEFSFYSQMVIVFEALIAGVLVFVFMVCNDAIRQKTPLVDFKFEDMAAFMILGIGMVMGLQGIMVAGFSISSIICRLGILVAASLWGAGGGTMVGVMTGIIPSVTSRVFAQSLGMYAVSGLLAGLFSTFGRLGVMLGFMLGTLGLTLFISETQATILGMWESIIACALFFLLSGWLKEKVPYRCTGAMAKNIPPQDLQMMDARLKEAARERIENLARVFEELSSTFSVQAAIKPGGQHEAYLSYLFDEISHGFCEKCSRHENCWGREAYSTSQEIMDLFTLAETHGQIIYEECPGEFRRRCIYGRELVNTVNYLFDHLRLNEYWSERLGESRELVSKQMKGASQIIKDLAKEIDVRTRVDFELREQLIQESQRLGLKGIKDFTPVMEGDQLYLSVRAVSCANGEQCEQEWGGVISSLLGERMEVCEKNCPRFRGKVPCEFTLNRAFSYRVVSGAAQVGKEEVCGDSFTIATLKEGKELIALSDGMGVGKSACNESQAAVRLLENLLSCGFERELALKTINSVLLLKSSSDMFATLDMVMVDLYTGQVDFVKISGAPSFIKRGKRVGMVISNSLPIGIMDEVDVISEKRSLCPGDIIVLVSDGVVELNRGNYGEAWIQEFLSAIDENDPQVIAEMILHKALGLCHGKPRDDMTVVCARLDLNYPH